MKMKSILCLALLWAFISHLGFAQTNDTAGESTNYAFRVLTVDRKRDGPVDLKVTLAITNLFSHESVKLVCHHWTLGKPDWLIDFISIEMRDETNLNSGENLAHLISNSAKVAENVLMRDYSPDPVSVIHLREANMPEAFTQDIYRILASHMSREPGKAQPAYDRKLKRMLQTTFDESKALQLIAEQLNRCGFSNTRATPPELISVRRELFGKSWSKIAHENAAGLQEGSATVIYYDLRRQKVP